MGCVIDLLQFFGCEVILCEGKCLLVIIKGVIDVVLVCYQILVVSVQIKFVVLLVGLNVLGEIVVIEMELICDYIECMLVGFGVIIIMQIIDQGCVIMLQGCFELKL